MGYIATNLLIQLLSDRLTSLPLDPANPDADRLFQRVGAFGSSRLTDAMKATFASEDRVCFIVPVGDKYNGFRDRNLVVSTRSTRLVLLIADRSLDADKVEALTGGSGNPGILALKDAVIKNLTEEPFTGPDLAFEPGDGEPLLIQSKDNAAGNAGRECWAQHLISYAGEVKFAVP